MTEERIDLASGRATLILGGRRAHELAFDEIRALHIVGLDHMWLHDDEPFYVLVTDDRVWVLPDDAVGLPALLEALLPGLFREGKVRQTTAPRIPWRWRRGRLVRALQLPRLSEHPVDTIPDWEARTVGADEIKRMTGVEI